LFIPKNQRGIEEFFGGTYFRVVMLTDQPKSRGFPDSLTRKRNQRGCTGTTRMDTEGGNTPVGMRSYYL
jgi:hypothetical protein